MKSLSEKIVIKKLISPWRYGLLNFAWLAAVFISFCPVKNLSYADDQAGYPVKDLSLSVGVYHDEPIPNAPANISQSGTFRSKTKVQYNPNTKILRFYPRETGVATLMVQNPATGAVLYEFHLDIKKTDLRRVAREIGNLLNDIEGISIKVLNSKVIVDGQILLPRDMARIHTVVKQYGGAADTLVVLSPIAQRKIAELIERDINNPEITVRAVNGKFILEGFANDRAEKDRAEIISKTYVPDVVVDTAEADKKILPRKVDVVINLIKIKPAPADEPKKIVQMVVHYVELQKDYTKGFRFQWTPDIGDNSSVNFTTGGKSPGGIVSTITGTISNLLPKLNWAKEHGHARILQSSSLIVQDGNPGIINSISRIPYQVVNSEGQPSTSFEETGIRTNITPAILGVRSDSVQLQLNFAVKSLVSYTDQGPLTSSREIQTVIVVRSGQSAAVGGLISNESGTNYNKLPANASRNPIISLYASKDFRRSQSQFVVFVTPIIKSSASAGSEKIKRKFRLNN
ncbi:MAG: BON domain-containing protein [Bdellovibrionales bacterium]|nr:BON domain-containing protein [Bdellovibrionales bacterium]